MESSLAGMCRPVRRRLIGLIRRSDDALVVRRAMAVLSLGCGNSAAEVARETGAARSSVQSCKWSFLEQRGSGLQLQPRGRRPSTVTPALITRLLALLEGNPSDYGYLRSTWTSELLALSLERQHGFIIHASTIRRLPNRLDWVWRRARPTLCIRDSRKQARMAAINRALQRAARADTAVLYVKAWSQNLGHEKVLTTFLSYGQVDTPRQGEIIRSLGTPQIGLQPDVGELAKALVREMLHSAGEALGK